VRSKKEPVLKLGQSTGEERKEAKGSQEEGQETGKAAENDLQGGAGAYRI
jgi:hypothetical protein